MSPCLCWLMLPWQLISICFRSFACGQCGTGLRALTAYLRIPGMAPMAGVLTSNVAHITAELGPERRPQNNACPSCWESPIGNARFHWIPSFHLGSHDLPNKESRHIRKPQASRVCNSCNTGVSGDERHILLECPALAGLRLQFCFTRAVAFRHHEAAPLGQRPA